MPMLDSHDGMPDGSIVLSVPAGKSYDLVLEHFIYSCPISYNYRSTDLITFRTAEGLMEKLFTISRVVKLNPLDIDASFGVPDEILQRIRGYLGVAQNRGVLDRPGEYRFYLLDEESAICLPHQPRARTRLQGAAYFQKCSLLSGERYVNPDV
jgi:hypothetical protein